MNRQFLEANRLDALRKLHSVYSFNVDSEQRTPEVTVRIWELLGADLAPNYKYEAELSHTIQNSNQGSPYSPMPIEQTPERAAEVAISGFMSMYDGATTRIEKREEA